MGLALYRDLYRSLTIRISKDRFNVKKTLRPKPRLFQSSKEVSVNHSIRVSFETSFDSKQPKLEPKLVSALSETKCLFRLFRFCTEKESFDVQFN
jgi:hypothetical protein